MAGFVVKYKITGFDAEGVYHPGGESAERTSEVYDTMDLAFQNADDIRGYEGVEYAFVCPAPEKQSSK